MLLFFFWYSFGETVSLNNEEQVLDEGKEGGLYSCVRFKNDKNDSKNFFFNNLPNHTLGIHE